MTQSWLSAEALLRRRAIALVKHLPCTPPLPLVLLLLLFLSLLLLLLLLLSRSARTLLPPSLPLLPLSTPPLCRRLFSCVSCSSPAERKASVSSSQKQIRCLHYDQQVEASDCNRNDAPKGPYNQRCTRTTVQPARCETARHFTVGIGKKSRTQRGLEEAHNCSIELPQPKGPR